MKTFLKIFIITLVFFNTNEAFSQLDKYNFKRIKLKTQNDVNKAKYDALDVARLLLKSPINKDKDTRYDAGVFLSEWMNKTNDHTFGTGNLKSLFGNKVELGIISMAAQVKYCVENNASTSYSDEAKLGIWTIIIEYIENKKNKVVLTTKLRRLLKAKKDNTLAEFLDAND